MEKQHECHCPSPAGSIHGTCNKCRGRLPKPIKGFRCDKSKGWTGSKVRSRAIKMKKGDKK